MTKLRRWSEDGATPSELALLEASSREVAPRSARARTLGALGVSGTVLATSTTAATSSAAAAAMKVVGVALLVGGTAGGALVALVWHASVPPAVAPGVPHMAVRSQSSAVRASAAPPPKQGSPAAVGVEAAVEPPTGDVAARLRDEPPAPEAIAHRRTGQLLPQAAAPPPAASPGTLGLEVAALERAHEALSAHDPDGALRALDRYRTQFPGGELSSEETVLRVEGLLALGASSRAASLANAYAAAHPEDAYTRRLRELVRDAQKE